MNLVDIKDGKDKDVSIEYHSQGRAESASLTIASVFGIFSILILFTTVEKFSLAWFVLSTTYWIIMAYGIQLVLFWAFHVFIVNHFTRKHYPNEDKEIQKIAEKSRILKWAYWNFWHDPNDKLIGRSVWFFSIGLFIIGLLLYYVIAFDHGCIDHLTSFKLSNGTMTTNCNLFGR